MEKKLSGSNLATKIILVIMIIILLLALSFYAIIDGVVDRIQGFFSDLAGSVSQTGSWLRDLLGISKIEGSMQIYLINDEHVGNLKNMLEGASIDTESSGLTEIRLRKILLAYSVSTSLSDTLCTVPVSEEEIISNINKKDYGRDFDTIDDFTSYCSSNGKKKDSKDIWPIDDPNYDLYYDSDVFFYFKDKSKKLGDNAEQWYLGAMGATTITTQEGTELTHYDEEQFNALKTAYDSKDSKDKPGSDEEKQLLTAYTDIGPNKIRVYKIKTEAKTYDYTFENQNIETINLEGVDETNTYTVETQDLDLGEEVDTSSFTISIELMVDMLDITGSGEFLEEFIDYSLNKTEIKAKAYTTLKEEITYSKKTYNIKDDFVFEAYDVIDRGEGNAADWADDNYRAYKDIIFRRKYNAQDFNRVTDLSDFDEITMNGEPRENDTGTYSVDWLCNMLKSAYNPPQGFVLGTIEVTEEITNLKKENKWEVVLSEANTWYGEAEFAEPYKDIKFTVPGVTSSEATSDDFENFNADKLLTTTPETDKTEKVVYLSEALNNQSQTITENGEEIVVVEGGEGADLYDNILSIEPGVGNESNYDNWTIRGLGNIATNDTAEKYNESFGAGHGNDFIYTKYTKSNIKNYEEKTKIMEETLQTSNVISGSSSNTEQILKEFLELLKNETGNIPTSSGSEGGFKEDGIVVEYADIYDGHIPAGDLLLDNGALMLFELLESTENTQNLVNVFKYLAYLYSGTDYGVTDISQIEGILGLGTNSANDYIVNTELSSQTIVLSKEQLEQAIKATYSGSTQSNLLGCLDEFIEIQTNNKVNAVFAVATTIIESSGGTNWAAIDQSTYNWMSVTYWTGTTAIGSVRNGNYNWCKYRSFNHAVTDFGEYIQNSSHYFKNGKNSVIGIASTYCNEQWGVNIVGEMSKIYNSIGISTRNKYSNGILVANR